MEHPEIALVLSAVCFGLVIGFLAGYGVRAYLSYLHRRANGGWQAADLLVRGANTPGTANRSASTDRSRVFIRDLKLGFIERRR